MQESGQGYSLKNYTIAKYQKHPGCKKSCSQELKKVMLKKIGNQKMGSQGQCSDSADGNKILIITIQAAKYYSYQ